MTLTNERHALELAEHHNDYLIVPIELERTLMSPTGEALTAHSYRFTVVESDDCSKVTPPYPFEFASPEDAIGVGKRFVEYLKTANEKQVG